MGRREPDIKGRLQEAALELCAERGFDQTTAAQIAERVDVTERTFFRHFADKRDVFFAGFALIQNQLVQAVERAPGEFGALDSVGCGLHAAAGLLGQSPRELAARRHAVVAATPVLQERERSKFADFAATIAEALRNRGVPDPQATFAAEVGTTVLRISIEQWTQGDEHQLTALIEENLARLRTLVAGT